MVNLWRLLNEIEKRTRKDLECSSGSGRDIELGDDPNDVRWHRDDPRSVGVCRGDDDSLPHHPVDLHIYARRDPVGVDLNLPATEDLFERIITV